MWQDDVPLPTARAHTILMFVFVVSVALLVFIQWLGIGEKFGVASNRHDLMYYTGFLVSLPALLASFGVDRRFQEMLIQVREDGVVRVSPAWWDKSYKEIRKSCRRWQIGSSLFVGLAVLFTFDFAVFPGISGYIYECMIQSNPCDLGPRYLSFLWELPWSFGLFVLISIAFGFLVGQRLGTMASTSRAVKALFVEEAVLKLQPRHDDQLGGFSRMGSLIAVHGILAAVPLVFLTVWLFLISLGIEQPLGDEHMLSFDRYSNWSAGFLAQSIVALLFIFVCFIRPFATVQTAYRIELEKEKKAAGSVFLEELSKAQRAQHVSTSEAIRGLPSSPVVPSLKFTFTVSNAAPYFLLAASMLLPEELKLLLEGVLSAVIS